MEKDFAPDLITLIDEEGNEHNFEILDKIETEENEYYALYPIFDEAEESLQDSGEYYIMEAVITENGEEELAEIDDEALLDKLAEQFEKRFEELFDDEMTKLDKWAEDRKNSLEIELKQLDKDIKTQKTESKKIVKL